MEHKWLGAGLVAMGVVGLCTLLAGPGGAERTAPAGPEAGVVRVLPFPGHDGGMGVYEALAMRRASRDFDGGESLPDEVLGRILWAAAGVNRDDGRLTIPTALDSRDLRVFVLDGKGIWLYLPEKNALRFLKAGDWRAASGKQGFAGEAAVNLVYAVDPSVQAGKGVPLEAIAPERCVRGRMRGTGGGAGLRVGRPQERGARVVAGGGTGGGTGFARGVVDRDGPVRREVGGAGGGDGIFSPGL